MIDRTRFGAAVLGVAVLTSIVSWLAWLAIEQGLPRVATKPSLPIREGHPVLAALYLSPGNKLATIPGSVAQAPAAADAPVLDLCGLGRMPSPGGSIASAPGAAQSLPAPLGEFAVVDALAQLNAALARGTPREQAVAVVLKFSHVQNEADLTRIAEGLAALARGRTDPVVTGWALTFCQAFQSTACSGLDVADWTTAEPDNANAWLHTQQAAGSKRVDAINQGLAGATRFSAHFGVVAATVLEAWPANLADYLQVPLLVQAIALDSHFSALAMQAALSHCKAETPMEGSHHRACDVLAEAMTQRGDTLMAMQIGSTIGKRTGWSPERIASMKLQADALAKVYPVILEEEQPYSCRSRDALRQWIHMLRRGDELAALRASPGAGGVLSVPSVGQSRAASTP